MFGLRPDAGIWRQDFLPPVEERLAQLLERQDAWSRALLSAQLGHKEIKAPGEIRIPRPSDPEPVKPRVETDPKVIAQFFTASLARG